jgi:hypothetical protein
MVVHAAAASLQLVLSPLVACDAPPGTVVAQLLPQDGDSNQVSLSLDGDVSDFALQGATIVVGPNGIAAANCGQQPTVTVTATQD